MLCPQTHWEDATATPTLWWPRRHGVAEPRSAVTLLLRSGVPSRQHRLPEASEESRGRRAGDADARRSGGLRGGTGRCKTTGGPFVTSEAPCDWLTEESEEPITCERMVSS
ncbi:uncharacterized protein [Penaeus vannamei]|uniref:uncharacterized protein n=1 Tax=Penaeus vannamei TaxID=6689 RepID=UPI00387F437C